MKLTHKTPALVAVRVVAVGAALLCAWLTLAAAASAQDAGDRELTRQQDTASSSRGPDAAFLDDELSPEEFSEELPLLNQPALVQESSSDGSTTQEDADALPLRRPPTDAIEQPDPILQPEPPADEMPLIVTPWQVPSGFSGPSGIAPLERQQDSHFVPVPDRWRSGFPAWDRYGPDHSVIEPQDPFEEDAPYARGSLLNPFRQNVIKGDYPIIGQHTFLNVTATSFTNIEFRQVPTPTTPFETTPDPGQEDFFGDPDQFFFSNDLKLSVELNHGDAGFKPFDWRARITPIFNMNYLDVEEFGIVSPDVRRGTHRYREDWTIEEWFVEAKLCDTGPYYDFTSMRVGSQPFVSDFRGFIFADINRAVRLFGTRNANRDQFNLIFFDQREKETNSALNTTDDRDQNVLIANYFRQDFIFPGYTAQASIHYNHDEGKGLVFDRNGFLARPDPAGVFEPHTVDAVYFGFTGDGHINRFNIQNAFYQVVGHDELNPLAGQEVDINAQMAALEISYDRDWIRFRSSVFWASGDDNILDDDAEGFDAIFDNPNFAGGGFSFWQRQSIKLLGVNLTDRFSLLPHLRSSKIEGQTNFVNPGLFLANFGSDIEVTPRLRLIGNVNLLWFEDTSVIEQFVFQSDIDEHIGTDISLGFEGRPLLNDNLIFVGGVSTLIPGEGFEDIYNPITGSVDDMFAVFLEVTATY